MYVGKSERTKGVTWGGGWGELDRCQPGGDNCFVVPLHLSLTHSSGSCSLCPILSGVRPPGLVTLTERSKMWGGENDKTESTMRRKKKTKNKNWAPPLLYSLHHSLFLSPLLSRVLIITRFCVTGLNKALPCLDYFLLASVDVHAFAGFNHN